VGTSVPERFSDPLSAVMPDGGERARTRLRLAGALLFAAGAFTMTSVLAAPDPDASDHPALAACTVVYAAIAALLLAWRNAPGAVLHAICPAGTVACTAAVAFAEPVGLTPIFYLWPMLIAAYFLGRREVAANFAFMLASCGVAFGFWIDPTLRVASFMAVLAIVGVATAVVVVLREQVLALVVRLRTLASHDSLTGALNRGAFEQRLDAELARTQRTSAPLALVVFDVDHFKAINDSFGHAAGDAALRAIGDEVATAMRRSDVFGRLGGEEFGLVLPDTDIAGAAVVADKLRRRLAEPGAGPALTASFGVAQAPRGSRSSASMLDEADRALYAAKRGGRDRVVRSDQVEPQIAAPWPRSA
jgi:diguanylate cyclase (GGDEF)-like protein